MPYTRSRVYVGVQTPYSMAYVTFFGVCMSLAPTLLIQMQRMGDLVMTFPLMERIVARDPDRPLWVVAEPHFFNELLPLTPSGVTYVPYDVARTLGTSSLHSIINVSHRDKALALAGNLEKASEHGVVGLCTRNNVNHIRGDWALYRQSIVENNRHNLFHWADLHMLDLEPPNPLSEGVWPTPKPMGRRGKVGLFVGASEEGKRPEPAFWGDLAKQLYKKGLHPVFLGGPGDKDMAAKANLHSGLPGHNNLAGHFSLAAFTGFVQTLDLMITPDTGPMHLAAWAKVPVLNISMGPVNPWETGPMPPGHWVLTPARSCAGCWVCKNGTFRCKDAFLPSRVARLIEALLRGEAVQRFQIPGVRLGYTARRNGLYDIVYTEHESNVRLTPHTARYALSRFWQSWFLEVLGQKAHGLGNPIKELEPISHLYKPLLRTAVRVNNALALSLRHKGKVLGEDFWSTVPPLARPFSSYLHLLLQNGDYERPAWGRALTLSAHLSELLSSEKL